MIRANLLIAVLGSRRLHRHVQSSYHNVITDCLPTRLEPSRMSTTIATSLFCSCWWRWWWLMPIKQWLAGTRSLIAVNLVGRVVSVPSNKPIYSSIGHVFTSTRPNTSYRSGRLAERTMPGLAMNAKYAQSWMVLITKGDHCRSLITTITGRVVPTFCSARQSLFQLTIMKKLFHSDWMVFSEGKRKRSKVLLIRQYPRGNACKFHCICLLSSS